MPARLSRPILAGTLAALTATNSFPGEPAPLRAVQAEPSLKATLTGSPHVAVLRGLDGSGVDFARAASEMRQVGQLLWVIQDDSACVASVPMEGGPGGLLVLFPELAERFGQALIPKHTKPDLELLLPLDLERPAELLALSSGSKDHRCRAALFDGGEPGGSLIGAGQLPSFYEWLRAQSKLIGTELNLEGAANLGEVVRLFQRGNGKVEGARRGRNATVDLDQRTFGAYVRASLRDPSTVFDPSMVRQSAVHELGELDGGRATFSAACELGSGWAVYAAAAELSADAYEDGPTTGSMLGLIDREGHAWQAPVRWPDGSLARFKLEGVVVTEASGDTLELLVCADQDQPDRPSPILRARLSGPQVRNRLENRPVTGGR